MSLSNQEKLLNIEEAPIANSKWLNQDFIKLVLYTKPNTTLSHI